VGEGRVTGDLNGAGHAIAGDSQSVSVRSGR
jgi:hypothetical protein